MLLSKRLQTLADLVREGVVLADIGTDHGYLPVALLAQKKIIYAVATDIHKGPLEKASVRLRQYGFSNQSDCRLGNGLCPLHPGECDDIVIAGMGGLMIRDILEASEETARRAGQLILQPMNNSPVLRRYLAAHHYSIFYEGIVEEKGYYYEVICVRDGEMPELSLAECVAGYAQARHENDAFKGFVKEQIRKTEEILSTLALKDTENVFRRAEECRAVLNALGTVRI